MLMTDGFPRRNRIDLLTPVEKSIYDAVQAVENLPPDIRLTEAVCLLQEARSKVADYVEGCVAEPQEEREPMAGHCGFFPYRYSQNLCRACGLGIAHHYAARTQKQSEEGV